MGRIQAACLALIVSADALAHHAFTGYDTDNPQSMEGEVTAVFWRNPHIVVTIERVLENGEREIWEAEGGALNSLLRAGVGRDVVAVGDRVSLFGVLSRREQHHMAVYTMTASDGSQVPLWPRRAAQIGAEVGVALFSDAAQEEGARQARGIFRVWSRDGSWSSHSQFTEAASTAREAFDPAEDNPALDCIPQGMPSIMSNPFPIEFVDARDRIILRLELWDGVRTIHLSEDVSSEELHPSPLGYSTGRWEDSTLIVETRRINDRYFDMVGTPQTDAIEVVERFALNQTQDRLDYHAVITDHATFTEPATLSGSWSWVPGEEVKPFECTLRDG